jgi:WD40 repeat protein
MQHQALPTNAKVILSSLIVLLIAGLGYKLWLDSTTGWPIRIDNAIFGAAISPDRQRLQLSAGEIHIWQLPERVQTHIITGPTVSYEVAWSPDSQYILQDQSNQLTIWNSDDGSFVATLQPNTDKQPVSLTWSYDGAYIAAGFSDETSRIWSINQQASHYDGQTLPIATRSLVFSPVENILVFGTDQALIFWDVERGQEIDRLEAQATRALTFSDDGLFLAGARGDTVEVWNVQERERIQTISGVDGSMGPLDFSPDNRLLITGGGWDASGFGISSLYVWRISDGKLVQQFDDHTGGIREAKFMADGKTIIAVDLSYIRIWKLSKE